MATGVNVSKANLYAVLSPPAGVNVSKANLYAVLSPPAGVGVSKANLYAVLYPTPSSPALPMSARAQVLFGEKPWQPRLARRFAPPAAAPVVVYGPIHLRSPWLFIKEDWQPLTPGRRFAPATAAATTTIRPVLFVIT
jgi:hypothetical protein